MIGKKDPWGDPWEEGLMDHDLKPFSFAELGGPDSGLADSDFGRDRDETEEKVGAMEDEMERRKRQAIVNRARNTDVNESGGDRM